MTSCVSGTTFDALHGKCVFVGVELIYTARVAGGRGEGVGGGGWGEGVGGGGDENL